MNRLLRALRAPIDDEYWAFDWRCVLFVLVVGFVVGLLS